MPLKKKESNAAFCYTPSHKVIILGTELLENFVSLPTKISSAIPLNSRGWASALAWHRVSLFLQPPEKVLLEEQRQQYKFMIHFQTLFT